MKSSSFIVGLMLSCYGGQLMANSAVMQPQVVGSGPYEQPRFIDPKEQYSSKEDTGVERTGIEISSVTSIPQESSLLDSSIKNSGKESTDVERTGIEISSVTSVPQESSLLDSSIGNSGSEYLIKGCNNQFGITSDPNIIKNAQEKGCVEKIIGVNPIFETRTALGKLSQQLRIASTRLEANLNKYNDFDKEMVAVILDYLANTKSGQQSPRLEDYYLSINPDTIRFMFSLCVKSYYDNRFSLNSNNISIEYQKLINKQDAEISKNKNLLAKIERFKDFIKRTFGEETIVRLQEKRIETEMAKREGHVQSSVVDGKYDSHFGVDHTSTSGSTGFHHDQGGSLYNKGSSMGMGQESGTGTQRSIDDVQIKSLAPDLVRAIAIQYNAVFSGERLNTDNLTLSDIEARLANSELEVKNSLLEAEHSKQILSDPRVGEFWAKLDTIFDRQADGFMPIDVLYRNTTPYKSNFLTKGIAASKANKDSKISGEEKEFSGIIMYKPKDAGKATNADEMIIAFSGSNSEEDWKHNFDVGQHEGLASVNLAAGIRVHNGIMRSLESSLQEAGTKLKGWFSHYGDRYKDGQPVPTLKIYLTGHSLGGALAMLMGVYIKQNIEPYLAGRANIDLKIYTFGAPAIFETDSAKVVEKMIGKNNIVRIWNVGDPVANMSLVKKSEEVFKNSLLMLLLRFRHVGLSIPLYDETQIGGFFDKLNPWKSHLSDRYNNLIVTNWNELAGKKTKQLEGAIISQGLSKDKILSEDLEQIVQFLRISGDSAVLPLNNLSASEVVQIIEEDNTPKKAEPIIANYQDVMTERYQRGERSQPKLARSDKNGITYTHNLPKTEVEVKLNRSTSCDVSNLVNKQTKTLLSDSDQAELSCGCCLSKNFFVSDDGSTTAKIRGIFGKKSGTIPAVMKHCEKYCKPIKGIFFPVGQDDVTSIGRFMDGLGLGEMWRQKGLN